jgi:hypothetical protein
MNDEPDREGQFKEYAEAGALCRSYEAHARTSMVLFVSFATATLAFIFGLAKPDAANVILAVLGIIFGAATLIVLFRTREFNRIANVRARELEKQLGLLVYSRLEERFKPNRFLPSIKKTYMFVVVCYVVVFIWVAGHVCFRWLHI